MPLFFRRLQHGLTFGRLPSQPSDFPRQFIFVTSLQSFTDIVCYGSVLFSLILYYLCLCSIIFYMYSFDHFSCALGSISSVIGSISSALPLPVSRERHGKLVDNFSHESDFTSLQDPFTSRPYKTPFYFYYCVPRKIRRGILLKTMNALRLPFPTF